MVGALASVGCRERVDAGGAPVGVRVPASVAAAAPVASSAPGSVPSAAPATASAAPLAVPELPEPCSRSDRGGALSPGQRVLVAPLRANYFPAQVRRLEASGQVRVESWAGNDFTVERERVYPLGAPAAEGELAGCYGGCRLGELWVACRFLGGDGRRVRVEDHAGVERSLPRADAIVFERDLQRQVRDFFAEQRRHEAFRAALAAAGRPAPPVGHRLVVGEVVLAVTGPKYLTAVVTAVEPRGCTVRWFGSVRTPSSRDCGELLPFPRAGLSLGEPAAPGDFVLAKGREDHSVARLALTAEGRLAEPDAIPRQSLEWQPYRVVSVPAPGLLEVEDREGRRRTERTTETFRFVRAEEGGRARGHLPAAGKSGD